MSTAARRRGPAAGPAPRPRQASATPHEPRLARIAAQIADPSRARMLAYLLDGERAPASELAQAAGVSASTASGHLQRLLDEGLVVCEPRGRHRYYALADGEVADALSALALLAERSSHVRRWASPERQRLREARCCYGHLAGRLGVNLFDSLRARGWLAGDGPDYELSDSGRDGLLHWGLPAEALLPRRGQRWAYACLDWSERRDHLAGTLGRALLEHGMQKHWWRRRSGERALDLTPTGRRALAGWLDEPAPPAP